MFYREAVHTAKRIGTTQTNPFGNQGSYVSIFEEKTAHIYIAAINRYQNH